MRGLLRMRVGCVIAKWSGALRSLALTTCCMAVSSSTSVSAAAADTPDPVAAIDQQIQSHSGLTGSYVLEKGEDSLLARAWLADHARRTIDVQYFIWSGDNVGILASESLLRAAERGVRVRVIVDDL